MDFLLTICATSVFFISGFSANSSEIARATWLQVNAGLHKKPFPSTPLQLSISARHSFWCCTYSISLYVLWRAYQPKTVSELNTLFLHVIATLSNVCSTLTPWQAPKLAVSALISILHFHHLRTVMPTFSWIGIYRYGFLDKAATFSLRRPAKTFSRARSRLAFFCFFAFKPF